MAEVHTWQNHPDARGVIQHAVAALAGGHLVVFPTDTGSVLAADPRQPEAVQRLLRQEAEVSLALGGPAHAVSVLPELQPLARRLTRRCWPGPIELLHPETPSSLAIDLNPVRDSAGDLRLRSPAHSAILHVILHLGSPLLISTPRVHPDPGQPGEGTAHLADLEGVALVIEDGPCLYPQGATVVRLRGEAWEVLREGVVSAEQIRVQLGQLIVFVCTGNTCRSPLAEVLCKKRLAERLGCTPEELPGRGFLILSAGLAAYPDDSAAEHAIEIARTYGMDLSQHASRPLDRELAVQADALVCMTRSHLEALQHHFSHLSTTPRLLSPEGRDLPDPIGQDESVYVACAAQIWNDLESLVNEITAARA